MGYDLTGYKLKPEDSTQYVSSILNGDTDEEDYLGLAITAEEKVIIDRCLIDEYGFKKTISPDWIEYQKNSIQISVSADFVGIRVPYWESAKADMQLGFEIVNKITERTEILFWDPQSGEFLDDASEEKLEVYEYGLQATNDIMNSMESEQKSKSAWWQFWK